jgi:hypothetical protein
MNSRYAWIAAAALLLSAASHAHDCSGGADGGMDATGNQCSPAGSAVAPAETAAKPEVRASPAIAPTPRPGRTVVRTSNGSERLARAAARR